MEKNQSNVPPAVSIEEALQMFLAIAYPGGLPEGEEGQKILNTFKEKIAQDRPDWEKAYQKSEPKIAPENESYSELKARIAENAQKEDIPSDPDERYLYLRRKEAHENRLANEAQEKEARHDDEIRRRLIEKNRSSDKETIERAILIRKALEKRAQDVLKNRHEQNLTIGNFTQRKGQTSLKTGITDSHVSPSISSMQTTNISGLRLSENFPLKHKSENLKNSKENSDFDVSNGEKNSQVYFLTTDDKIDYLRRFNENRRQMLVSKSELVSKSAENHRERKDERFLMDMDSSRNKKKEGFKPDSNLSNNSFTQKKHSTGGGLKL